MSDAVVIGAGSMVGAGVFAAWAPAAKAAGTGLLPGLVIAAVVAFCNATSSAQLAAVHPESGGTYVYGRRQLGPFWGHLAGWAFVVGKTASCSVIALTAGAYLWPEHQRWTAVAAVVAIVAVNIGGLTRTVAVTRVLLVVTSAALVAVVVAGWSSPAADVGRLTPLEWNIRDMLQSAGFLFFAFAGYARVATMGEEVRDPETTIPKAVPRTLAVVLVIYGVVGITALAVVPVAELAESRRPLQLVAEAGSLDGAGAITRWGAGVAALGVLLNLLPGVSRTGLAMARRRELPSLFAHIDSVRSLPLRAELAVAAVTMILIVALDLRGAIGFSSVAVLTYYAITNASALTLTGAQRRWPRPVAAAGLTGCAVLVLSLPASSVLAGAIVLSIGVVLRLSTTRRRIGVTSSTH